jgi:flagellar assembly factor FliW
MAESRIGREEKAVKIATTRFGVLEVPEQALITLPCGLIGLGHVTRLVSVDHEDAGWFRWWQAVDHPETAFVTIDPSRLVEAYALEGVDDDLRALGAGDASSRMVVSLVSLPHRTIEGATVNLLAPIVVNRATGQGRQVVLPEGRYSVAHPLGTVSGMRALEMAA